MDTRLDNPLWHSLTNQHAHLAEGDDLARRYLPDVARFGAVADDDASFNDLAALIPSGEGVALIDSLPPLGNTWELARELALLQMIYDGPLVKQVDARVTITQLSHADVPAMLELVERTHPGPFAQRTIEMGTYLAIWQDGRLAAMAGQRMHLPGYCEISAVCTHPDFQRRGYARQLIWQLIHAIQAANEVPFLHVFVENTSAIALYESMGFRVRRPINFYVLKRQ